MNRFDAAAKKHTLVKNCKVVTYEHCVHPVVVNVFRKSKQMLRIKRTQEIDRVMVRICVRMEFKESSFDIIQQFHILLCSVILFIYCCTYCVGYRFFIIILLSELFVFILKFDYCDGINFFSGTDFFSSFGFAIFKGF